MIVDYKLIGNRIKAVRKSRGYTQEALSEMIDVSVGYVSQVERGITKLNLEMLAKISTALGCDMADLISSSRFSDSNYLVNDLSSIIDKLSEKERRLLFRMLEYYISTEK